MRARFEAKYIALLDTMWGDIRKEAPRFFYINRNNLSGKRLYRITSAERLDLLVTNSCRYIEISAKHLGEIDAEWVFNNLNSCDCDHLLVCGKRAQDAFWKSDYELKRGEKLFFMPHPAARFWSEKLFNTACSILNFYASPYRAVSVKNKKIVSIFVDTLQEFKSCL